MEFMEKNEKKTHNAKKPDESLQVYRKKFEKKF